MTPGNIQRRKYPQRASLRDGPRANLKCESTAARVSRQYRRGRARLGSMWHPDEPSVQDLVNLNNPCPRRAGRSRGRPATTTSAAMGRVGTVWRPLDLPQGYHTPARGQSGMAHAPVPSTAAPGLACGRAMPGRGDTTQPPACKILGDRVELMIVRTLYGHKPIQITENDHRR